MQCIGDDIEGKLAVCVCCVCVCVCVEVFECIAIFVHGFELRVIRPLLVHGSIEEIIPINPNRGVRNIWGA